MIIVGISGRARSGKDTVASLLHSRYYYRVLHFADALKGACREVFNFSDAQLYGDEKETIDPFWEFSPRQAMQQVGDGLRKHVAADIWIKALARVIQKADKSGMTRVVIPDLRYANEAVFLRSLPHAVKLFRITRDAASSLISATAATHASETELDNYTYWDGVLVNNDTLADLAIRVDNLVSTHNLAV